MWSAVRDGGVLIVEDADFEGWCCDPPNAGFDLFLYAYRRLLQRRGGDHAIGRKLYRYSWRRDWRTAGDAGPAGAPRGSQDARVSTLEATADAILEEGVATRDQLTAALAVLAGSPTIRATSLCGQRVFQLWSRR